MPPRPAPEPESRHLMQIAVEKLGALPGVQLVHLVQYAITHLQEVIARDEGRLIRARMFNRPDEAGRVQGWLDRYRPQLDALRALETALRQAEAEDWGRTMAAYLRDRYRDNTST
jgi:hypothetical protein